MNAARLISAAASLSLLVALAGCKSQPEAPAAQAPLEAPATAERTTWLFVGDSLTAGFGVAADEIYTAHVEAAFRERGLPWTVRNAGVSGDTTAGVLRRIDWLLGPDVHTVFLVIGGNDGLRGLPVAEAQKNIARIVDAVTAKGARIVLAGMKMPPNYGDEYARAFERIYAAVARDKGVPLMPFFLDQVGGDNALNQPDGIHPNPDGHAKIARNVLQFLDQEKLLEP
jgi:acyl-CoA thioesterase-1